MGEVFEHVARDPIQRLNSLVIASDGAAQRRRTLRARRASWRPVAAASAARLAPALTGGDVFTDDRAPVEWLIDASIVEYAAEEGG